MRLATLVVLGTACGRATAPPPLPITAEDAIHFAKTFEDAAWPCHEARIAELMDRAAFHARIGTSASQIEVAEGLSGKSALARKLCTWIAGDLTYRFSHVRDVGGHLRPVLRKGSAFTAEYQELELVRSASDEHVRVADVYSYARGEWLSQEFGDLIANAGTRPQAMDFLATMARVSSIEATQPAEALAALDGLAPAVRRVRSIQDRRVTLARRISTDAISKRSTSSPGRSRAILRWRSSISMAHCCAEISIVRSTMST